MNSGSSSNLKGLHFPTSTTGYAVGDNGTILKTTDQGVSWTEMTTSYAGYWFWDVHFTSENIGYVVGETDPQSNPSGNGVILKTIDGGVTWTSLFSGNPDPIRDLFVLDANTLFASGGAESTTSYLWKSTDAGATWTATGPSYYDATLGGLYFLDANTGFFGLYESVFGNINPGSMTWMQTTDAGSTFNPSLISNSAGFWVFSTDFASPSIGYSSRATYSGIDSVYIKKTIDGGNSWTENTIPNYLGSIYNIDFIDANIGYGVGGTSSMSTVFKTIDGGATWISESTGTTEMLRASFFIDENTGIAVGDNGKIIKRQVSNAGINTVPSEIVSFEIYPNPTYGNSIIEVETQEPVNISISVVSIEGKTDKTTTLPL
ncbi:MAG: hypothetical protein L3J74_08810 [Bacteroidales bacterium]|nr:hypothetical protein [Bacteroidales bacterium]